MYIAKGSWWVCTILNYLTDFAGLSFDNLVVSQLGSEFADANISTTNMTGDAANRVASATEASIRV